MPRRTLACLFLLFASVLAADAQATGIITGSVTDSSGAVIPNATVSIANKETSFSRSLTANTEGLFSAPSLAPGPYQVRVTMEGFRTLVRDAEVLAGGTTTVDMSLTLGGTAEVINVEAATAQINYESHAVQGVIQRDSIQDLPLNGRSFLQLATLQPGVTISSGSTSTYNALFTVSTLGQAKAVYTIDGGNVVNQVLGSWNAVNLNMSQEMVQEFQISTVNFDLATGISPGGAINVVTRSGSNAFHGAGYYYFRDHNMAAYPALKRPCDPSAGGLTRGPCIDPSQKDTLNRLSNPYFVRRNPGFWVGGPIKKDRLFFFFNLESYKQQQVNIIQQDLASLQPLNTTNQSPYSAIWPSVRMDYRLSPKHSVFLRYTHDGNTGIGPASLQSPEYSFYTRNYNYSDQAVVGITSILTPNLVNDFRLPYHYFYENTALVDPASCTTPCVGGGLPSVMNMVGSSTFAAGEYYGAPQVHISRSFQLIESLNWQKGAHRLRVGVDWEHMNAYYYPVNTCNQVCTAVYSPEQVRIQASAAQLAQYFPNLPSQIRTNADLLNLPVSNTAAAYYSGLGIGSGNWPGPYNFDQNRVNDRPAVYVTDTWKLKPNLTVNMGLRWARESGLFNSDLPRPAYLSPILLGQTGGVEPGLGAPQPNNKNFSPTLGFAWSPRNNHKMVIRGGAGIYYDTMQTYQRWRDTGLAGPVGNGRMVLAASILTNEFPNAFNITTGQAIPVGANLPLSQLTSLTLGQFLQIYDHQLPGLLARFSPPVPKSGPYTVTGLDLAKQGLELYPSKFPVMHSYQTSIGVQRDLGHDFVLTADYARRLGTHAYIGEVDLNRYNRYIGGVNTPVFPKCTGSPLLYAPGQNCSSGPITFWMPVGRSSYNGLLVNVQKRMSKNYQINVSYALQSQSEITVIDLDNYFAGYGPNLANQNLNVSGVVNLPWGLTLSLNSQFISRPTVNPTIPGVDLTGSGITTLQLTSAVPGLSFGCFNHGCGKDDLVEAIQSFNANYSTAATGKRDARGAVIPTIPNLPASYDLGRPTITQDIRVTKSFKLKEQYKFSVFGEAFNIFNIANLSGYSYTLTSTAFGQPTQRAGQVFGSSGPRALQVGGRFSF
jgi:hypothetical protein